MNHRFEDLQFMSETGADSTQAEVERSSIRLTYMVLLLTFVSS